jgi:hypothetical protein
MVSKTTGIIIAVLITFALFLISAQDASAGTQVLNYTASTTWTVPGNVTKVLVETWGGGAAGGGRTANGRAGGGGGGAFAKKNITVKPGTTYTVTVGAQVAGGTGNGANGNPSWFNSTTTIYAAGGSGGGGGAGAGTGGAGGTVAGSVGTIRYAGGNGGTADLTWSGGGGGGAGTTGAGGNANVGTAGTGTALFGGNGGAGLNANNNGNPGNTYGGGGGGARRGVITNRNGGAGAAGRLSISIDRTPPTWVQAPTSRAVEFTYPLYYDINATDPLGISQYRVNDTAYFKIDKTTGVLQNNTGLPVGVRWIRLYVNDSNNNINSTRINVTVRDTTAPTWNQTPQNKTIEFTSAFYYDLNASDASGISQYKVNDTTYFKINSATGVLQNNTLVPVGIRWLNVSVNDTKNNRRSTKINVTVKDRTAPTWNQTPTSRTLEFTYPLYYDINASDASGISQYKVNDTTKFKINSVTGVLQNNTGLNVGVYWLNLSVNDTKNNKLSVRINVTVRDTTAPAWNQTPTSRTVEWGTAFYYHVNASDASGISKYNINDTTYFKINSANGTIQNNTLLPLGTKWLNISVNDTKNNKRTISINITTRDTRKPAISLTRPPNNFLDIDGNITFNCSAADNYALSKIELYLGGVMNQSKNIGGASNKTFFNIYNLVNGNYNWNCKSYDSSNNFNQSANRNLIVNKSAAPASGNFSGNTTNWNNVENISNVCNGTAILDNPLTDRIQWHGCVNALGANFDSYAKLAYNNVTINFGLSTTFNSSATIVMRNLTWDATPVVYMDGVLCPPEICSNVFYDLITRTAVFNVTHFSSFVTQGNSQMMIWDQTDAGMPYAGLTKYKNQQVKFFANYTRKNNGNPITGANCAINFSDFSKAMVYNATTKLYEQNRTFATAGTYKWNVTCSRSGFQTLKTNDTVLITADTIAPTVTLNSPLNGYNTTATTINFNWTARNGVDPILDCNLTIDSKVNASNIASPNGTAKNHSVSGFGEGTHYWNVTCIDDSKNKNISVTRRFTIDRTAPTWMETPGNKTIGYGYLFYYDINATDPRGISQYNVNDTTYFKIDKTTGVLQNKTLLPVGVRWLNISVNDTLNNKRSIVISITVHDITPPTWNQTPASRITEFTYPLYYDVNASDNVAVDKYRVNDSTTYFKINSVTGVLQNKTLLPVGVRWINISVNDTKNNKLSEIISVTTSDTIAPAWTETPASRTLEFTYPLYYDINASDASGISQYNVNDTNFNIDKTTGVLQNNTGLAVGVYWLNISVNDTKNNKLSVKINITVRDTTAPTWNQTPTSRVIEYASPLYYRINASDASGISQYKINDTTNFKINSATGVLQNNTGLNVGVYWLNLSVNDTKNNRLSIKINVTVQDTTPPTWNETPTNRVIPLQTPLYYDINASDASGIIQYNVNDTTRFKINSLSGLLQNNTGLATGTYWINISVNDTYNNKLSEIISVTVGADITPPAWNQTPTNQAVEYTYPFYYDVNATDNVAVDKYQVNDSTYFEINALTGVLQNKTLLPVGVRWINISVNDTKNNGLSAIISITTSDTIAPAWVEAPQNKIVERGTAFYYDLNATDASGISQYNVNDTNFNIDKITGVLQNNTGLAVGVYWLNISANDTSNNRLSAMISITVQDTTPPIISGVASGPFTNTTAVISWGTNENANSTISYGLTTTLGSTYSNSSLATSHSYTLTGLQVNKTYYYNVTSCDAYNNCRTDGGHSFTTQANAPDITPPTWVEAPANQAINLGDLFYYDVNATDNVAVDKYKINDTTNFKINAANGIIQNNTGLTTGVYWLNISVNDTKNNKLSAIISVTVGGDITPPTWIQTPQNKIIEYTYPFYYDVNATDNVLVDKYKINDTANFKINAANGIIQNNTELSAKTYWLNISVNDTSDNKLSAVISITVQDTTGPVISNANATSITNVSAIIVWDTNENANSTVSYGNTTSLGNYATSAAYLKSHSIPLSGLQPNTTYYYNVTSCDSSGNCKSAGTYTFNTTFVGDTTPPVISNVKNGTVTNSTAVIMWNTDELANSTINYGTTIALGTYYRNSTLTMSPQFILASLQPNMTYYYNVTSCDASGNCNTSGVYTFKTNTNAGPGDTTPPTIVKVSVTPLIVINGTDVDLFANATDANLDKVWAVITKPDSSTQTVVLTNAVAYSYTTPDINGRYNVTFYANDTSGNTASSKKYFIVQPAIYWNATVINHQGNGLSSSITFYYAGTSIKYNISTTGNFTYLDLANYLYDIEFRAFSERFRVKLSNVNLSNNNNKIFGMDRNTTFPGYLVVYSVNNSYVFANALLYLSYSGLGYTNENNLKVYRCSSWDFALQKCLSSFALLTATQNKTGDYFTATVTGFSAFAIKQESAPAGGGGGGGGGGAGAVIVTWPDDNDGIRLREATSGSIVYFNEVNADYTLTIQAVSLSSVSFELASSFFTLRPGQKLNIDLNGDGTEDIAISVFGINGDLADVQIERIIAPAEPEIIPEVTAPKETLPPAVNITKATENATKELPTVVKKPKNIWYYLILLLIVIVPFIVLGVVKYSHRRRMIKEAKKWLKSYSKAGIFVSLLVLAVILLIKPVTIGFAVFTGKVVPLAVKNSEIILIFTILCVTLLSLVQFANRNKIFVGKGIVVHKNKGQLIKKAIKYRWVGIFAVVLFLFGLILQPVVTGLMIFKDAIAINISLLLSIFEAILIAVALFMMVNYFNERNMISFGKEAITIKRPSSLAFVRRAGKRVKNKLAIMRSDKPQKEIRFNVLTGMKKKEEVPVHKIEEEKLPEPDKKKAEESSFRQIMKERVYNYAEYRKRQDENKAEAQPKEKIMLKKSAESGDKIKEKMLNNLNEVYGK